MNRVDVESAVIAMGDVAVCIKMVDDATEEGNAVQQGRAVQVLMDIFKARYARSEEHTSELSHTAESRMPSSA